MQVINNIIELNHEQALPICQIVNSASDDATRYNLLFVKVSGEQGIAEAVDGYTFARITLNDATKALLNNCNFFLDPDFCKAVLNVKANQRSSASIIIDLEAKTSTLIVLGVKQAFPIGENINYPNTDAVIPTYPDDAFSVVLNPELLLQVLESIRDDKKQKMVKLTFKETNTKNPIKVEVSGSSSFGIVMPGRF